MKEKIIIVIDMLINNIPTLGFFLAVSALVFKSYYLEILSMAAALHFLNEIVKAIKEKNKWSDLVAFMEYVLGINK